MRLPIIVFLLPAALMMALPPQVGAATKHHARGAKVEHPTAKKEFRSRRSAANRPKGNPFRRAGGLTPESANPNRLH